MSETDVEETVTLPVVEVERLRRDVAELEVKSQNLDDEAFALRRQLRETREKLDLSNLQVANLEATSETLVSALKGKVDEMEEARHEAEKARSALGERDRRVEDLLENLTAASEEISGLQASLGKMERLGV